MSAGTFMSDPSWGFLGILYHSVSAIGTFSSSPISHSYCELTLLLPACLPVIHVAVYLVGTGDVHHCFVFNLNLLKLYVSGSDFMFK